MGDSRRKHLNNIILTIIGILFKKKKKEASGGVGGYKCLDEY